MPYKKDVFIGETKVKIFFDFESLSELIQEAVHGKSVLSNKQRASRKEGEGRSDFFGTDTFLEGCRIASDGWPEAAKDIVKISTPIFEKISQKIEREDFVFDVEGQSIDIARFIDGEPESWRRQEIVHADGPGNKLIRIVYNSSRACGSTTQAIRMEGAAMVALIQLLEFSGYRVELSQHFASGGETGNIMDIRCVVKKFEDSVDLNKLAFCLCHASFHRRLVFSIREQLENRTLLKEFGIPNGGYGYPIDIGGYKDLSEIYIGVSPNWDWRRPEEAHGWIFEKLKNQGVHFKEIENR